MMTEKPKDEPQKLHRGWIMHKREITMADGKRRMTFYTFSEAATSPKSKKSGNHNS